MKVYDVLAENKQVDEGPIRFLKRTLGKNTAMGKSAQLDVELDKEVNNIYKDFKAVSDQRPDQGGMTAKGLANFLVAKGFASKPSEVMRFINQDPGLKRKIAKGAKKIAKAAGTAAGAVGGALSKAGGAVKKAFSPKKSDLTPGGDDRQLELPLANGMYSEAMLEAILNEVDIELDKGQIKKVIKGFVRKGFQSQLGSRLSKSSYGDNLDGSKGVVGSKAKAGGAGKKAGSGMMPSMDVQQAIKVLKDAGYKIDTKKKTVTV